LERNTAFILARLGGVVLFYYAARLVLFSLFLASALSSSSLASDVGSVLSDTSAGS
jgi:succinate dehydrogenase/fumarate reductase cytochrome b subunit